MSKSNEDDLRDILNNTALEIAQCTPIRALGSHG
jgi:hypothetical protein